MIPAPEWPIGEPCPVCGSPGILECELRIGADKIEMGWECRDCGHSVTWTARPDTDTDEATQYRAHVAASLESHPWARVLKVSDFTDYAGRWIMPTSRPEWQVAA